MSRKRLRGVGLGVLLVLLSLSGCSKQENGSGPPETARQETISVETAERIPGDPLVQQALSLIEDQDGNLLQTPKWADAIPLFRQAAEMQNAVAERYLGYVYATGSGISKDLKEAEKWYRTAAEHGDVKAQFNLALFCLTGADGETEPNIPEAETWFRAAAKQGHPDAQRFMTEILPQLQDRLPDELPDELPSGDDSGTAAAQDQETGEDPGKLPPELPESLPSELP